MIFYALLLVSLSGFAADNDLIIADYPIDVERFRPASDTYGYAVTESATTLGHLQVGVSIWGGYSDDSLVMQWNGERVTGPGPDFPDGLLDQRSLVNLQLSFGIAKWFSFSLDGPFYVWQEGFEPAAEGSIAQTADILSSGAGDLRIQTKFVIKDADRGYPIGLAAIAQLGVPTGSVRSFMGEGGVSGLSMLALEFADGSVRERKYRFRGALNAGARLKEVDSFRGLEMGSEFVYRAAISAVPTPGFEMGCDLVGSVAGERVAQSPLEIMPWLKILPQPWISITAGGGVGVIPGLGAPDYRVFVGASIAPSFDPLRLDRDEDTIPNRSDACINIPEDFDGFEDEDGCPEEDNDGDGILDNYDRCPNEPEDMDGYEDNDGCPDLEQDSDGDGIKDMIDVCPDLPEDFDEWEDNDGCPDEDNDGDGFLDVEDKCPYDREIINSFEDEDGCPDQEPRVVLEWSRIKINDKIFFEYDKDVIEEVSFGLLNEMAELIADHPELLLIRVEGHTDNDGQEIYNLHLSQSRAQAVVDYLVGVGIGRHRLDPAGFGEARPISDNETDDGKAENRRVEFLIVERDFVE